MEDMKMICGMMDILSCKLYGQLSGNLDTVDAKEAGEVADMIKDMAEAKRNCCEAAYYEQVVKAMEDRYGYVPPRWRKPYVDQEPYVEEYLNDRMRPESEVGQRIRMGYTPEPPMPPMHQNRSQTGYEHRYGQPYNEYREARRHYTVTNSTSDKDDMTLYATQHVNDMVATIRDIWKSADTDLKKRMKADLTALMNEMTV